MLRGRSCHRSSARTRDEKMNPVEQADPTREYNPSCFGGTGCREQSASASINVSLCLF